LSTIARAHGTTMAALLKLNGLTRPDLVREGQTLRLSGGIGTSSVAGCHIRSSGDGCINGSETCSWRIRDQRDR
jgi:LysM repeat protein